MWKYTFCWKTTHMIHSTNWWNVFLNVCCFWLFNFRFFLVGCGNFCDFSQQIYQFFFKFCGILLHRRYENFLQESLCHKAFPIDLNWMISLKLWKEFKFRSEFLWTLLFSIIFRKIFKVLNSFFGWIFAMWG